MLARRAPSASLTAAAALLGAWGWPGPGAAQRVGAEMGGGGAAGAYSALARGAYAVVRDPAALVDVEVHATRDRLLAPNWLLPSMGFRAGLEPVSLADLAAYSGRAVPAEARRGWLDRIERAGGQDGAAEAGAIVMAVRRGRWGASWTASARTLAALNPDAAEALLFGNAGRTGQAAELAFDGSSIDAWAASRFSLGVGAWLEELGAGSWAEGVSAGATLSWTVGHGYVTGADGGTTLLGDPVVLDGVFPLVQGELAGSMGSGLSVDLALRAIRGPWTLVLHGERVFDAFGWSAPDLSYRPGVALLGPDTAETRSPRLPLSAAPGSIQDRVGAFGFGRGLTVGAARALARGWVAADAACVFDAPAEAASRGCRLSTGFGRLWGDRGHASVGTVVEDGNLAFQLTGAVRLGRVLLEGSTYRRLGGRGDIGLGFGTTVAAWD